VGLIVVGLQVAAVELAAHRKDGLVRIGIGARGPDLDVGLVGPSRLAIVDELESTDGTIDLVLISRLFDSVMSQWSVSPRVILAPSTRSWNPPPVIRPGTNFNGELKNTATQPALPSSTWPLMVGPSFSMVVTRPDPSMFRIHTMSSL
jgi:hypothetical protein